MNELTLEEYKTHERDAAAAEARHGLWIHGVITIVVCVGLVAVNIFVASGFPWAVFPALGMSIGVFCHWYFGVKRGDEVTRRHQDEIELSARQRQAA